MAKIFTSVDDVLYRLKGQKVEPTRTEKVTIPGFVFGGTKSKTFPVDVSERGAAELRKVLERTHQEVQKAYGDLFSIIDKKPEDLSHKKVTDTEDYTDEDVADQDQDGEDDLGEAEASSSQPAGPTYNY